MVKINYVTGKEIIIEYVVPRGSVLDLLLPILYINSVCHLILMVW